MRKYRAVRYCLRITRHPEVGLFGVKLPRNAQTADLTHTRSGFAENDVREETTIDNAAGIRAEIERLRHMTVGRLKEKNLEVFGEEIQSGYKSLFS